MANALCVKLPNRAAITLSGTGGAEFLQGLVTQDMRLLAPGRLLYACFLTPQGKFLHDVFIRCGVDPDTIVLDCEGGERGDSLLRHLRRFTLRAKIALTIDHDAPVFQIWNGGHNSTGFPDPRLPALGYRHYGETPQTATPALFEEWDAHRIRHAVPDGSRDLIPEKSFIHEGRLDTLNAVSYTKGCYIGQELVSRMHHRGLAKKHLECVPLDAVPQGAEVRSSCGDIGLALVRTGADS